MATRRKAPRRATGDMHRGRILALVAAACTLFGGGGGYLISDFVSFRTEHRQELRQDVIAANTAATKVLEDIQLFMEQANGKRDVGEAERRAFQNNLSILMQNAKAVAVKVPEAQPEFDRYADAMVDLRKVALTINGPGDAKPFIEALSRFLKARNDFNEKIGAPKSYISTFS